VREGREGSDIAGEYERQSIAEMESGWMDGKLKWPLIEEKWR
jgi:hypothetical protein